MAEMKPQIMAVTLARLETFVINHERIYAGKQESVVKNTYDNNRYRPVLVFKRDKLHNA